MSNLRYFSEKKLNEKVFNPRLEYIDFTEFEHDWNSQLHSHHFMELALATEGNGTVTIGNIEYPVEKGNLVVIPPNRMHAEYSSEEAPMTYYIIGVRNLTFSESEDSAKYSENFNPVLDLGVLFPTVKSIFTTIFSEMKEQRPGFDIMIQSLLLKLSVHLTRITDLKASFQNTDEMKRGCALIKDYIDNHYSDKITIQDLTQLSCISKFHLIHEFSKYVGQSPIAYQLKCKIREAKFLLTSTDNSVSEISTTLGFSSLSHFSQRFKLEEGCTPLEFRKKSQQKHKLG